MKKYGLSLILFLCSFSLVIGQSSPPKLVPEQSHFTQTSRYKDVIEVVNYARKNASNLHYEVFGHSELGKKLPLLVFSDQVVRTPKQARALHRPIVLIIGDIHSGEVEGKEALLRLILELTAGQHQPWLKKVTLLLAPIYNADGNDMIDRSHRTNQYGPSGGVGTRANAKGLNLNRDFTKLAASESQGLVQNVLTKWDPMLFMDLHTTDGSPHGYHLTYASPLHPDTDARIDNFQRKKMLPELRREMKQKGWQVFDYGNFPNADPAKGWFTYSGQPRYSSNYYGLKNRLGLLSETYAYVDYKTRINIAEDFVDATISFMAKNAGAVQRLRKQLDRSYQSYSDTLIGTINYDYVKNPDDFPLLTSDLDTVYQQDVKANMLKRMGIEDTLTSKLYNRFVSTQTRPLPFAYALDNRSGTYDNLIKNLKMHGIKMYQAGRDEKLDVQQFEVEQVQQQRYYEGRQMLSLAGHFKSNRISLKDWVIAPTSNSNRMLIFQLLEPESQDGYVAWHMMGNNLQEGPFPVVKIMHPVDLKKGDTPPPAQQ